MTTGNNALPAPETSIQDTEAHRDVDRTSKPRDEIGAKAPLTNPLAFHITDWVPGPTGGPGAPFILRRPYGMLTTL